MRFRLTSAVVTIKTISRGDPLTEQDLRQVWFRGVHSDVGGSYPEKQSGLAKIALEWMMVEAERAGLG